MEFINDWQKDKNGLNTEDLKKFWLALSPFAPHMAEELWFNLGNKTSIHKTQWPSYDEKYLLAEELTIAIQINGKLRDTKKAKSEKRKAKSEIEQLARKSAKVNKYLEGKKILKVIYVEGKVINFVVA